MNLLSHEILLPNDKTPPTSLAILLHGLGADRFDLLDLGRIWQQILPHTVFVSPDAPFPCDMAPVGRQWFSLNGEVRTVANVTTALQPSVSSLNSFIEAMQEKFSIPSSKTALIGFSQGAMMSLYVAPRRKDPLAGVLAYSGLLPGADTLSTEALSKPPILLVHGEEDPVVPVQGSLQAAQILQENDFLVGLHTEAGLPHSIGQQGLEKGAAFLREILS